MTSYREFTVIIERDEDGYYVATVAELPGCHTQARTLEELMERVREAIQLYLETVGMPEIEVRKVRVRV
ncbi:MAG: type II toxin-antitoxin system HicB family antitoxin [Thermoprotei archaeon]|nr:MAG: type II toxin-antitoxin system HicB family antitoxin [Thermoprotei archaeon]